MTLSFLHPSDYPTWVIIIDKIITFTYYFISQASVGYTSMTYTYHVLYCRTALQTLQRMAQKMDPMELKDAHMRIQSRIQDVGEAFKAYLSTVLFLKIQSDRGQRERRAQ